MLPNRLQVTRQPAVAIEMDRQHARRRHTRGRVTLMDIYKDEDRRAWYLEGEAADDDRVDEALEAIQSG